MQWSTKRPDLNPIEDVQEVLARPFFRHLRQFETISELEATIVEK